MGDVDIPAPSDRRRIRSEQEKAALLAEVNAEGGKVRLVARRHNISESLLYNWRSARKAAAVAMGAPDNVEFIPARIIEGPASRAMSAVVPALPEAAAAARVLAPPRPCRPDSQISAAASRSPDTVPGSYPGAGIRRDRSRSSPPGSRGSWYTVLTPPCRNI